jgi:hypothetical protein
MHLLYLDESGHPDDPNLQHVVLAGFSTFERQAYWFSRELDAIAQRFNPADPASIELHGSPMRQGRDGWSAYPVQDRLQAMEDVLRVFANSHHSNRIFAVVINKDVFSRDCPGEDVIEYAFEQMASRFDPYLMRLYRAGDTQRGIVIFDKSTYETTLQNLAINFRETGHRWGVLRNLAEVPLFLDSKASRLIQLADMTSFSIFRNFERNDARFYDLISNRFDQSGGVVHGLHTMI